MLSEKFIIKRIAEQVEYINYYKVCKKFEFNDVRFIGKEDSKYLRSNLILDSAIKQKEYFEKLLTERQISDSEENLERYRE